MRRISGKVAGSDVDVTVETVGEAPASAAPVLQDILKEMRHQTKAIDRQTELLILLAKIIQTGNSYASLRK